MSNQLTIACALYIRRSDVPHDDVVFEQTRGVELLVDDPTSTDELVAMAHDFLRRTPSHDALDMLILETDQRGCAWYRQDGLTIEAHSGKIADHF